MKVKDLQLWLNAKLPAKEQLIADGVGGPKTREAIIKVFTNKSPKLVTEDHISKVATRLGDTSSKRIKAVATVESGGNPFTKEGLVKILWERHHFHRYTKQVIPFMKVKGQFISHPSGGGYTIDVNDNDINDSWEKLTYGACVDPIAAFSSISVGRFQVLGKYYKELGFVSPIDMIYAAANDENSHYDMLAGYILNVANLKSAFLRLSTNAETCRAFAKGYNGALYTKFNYHEKLAKAMK